MSSASAARAGAAPEPAGTNFSHRQIQLIMIGLMSGMLLAALDGSIVGTAMPRIVSDLGGLDKLAWVVTAYLLASTAVTPLWGKISDLYGRRLIFQVTIIIFLIGSALCGLAQDMPQLIIFRAIQGIGGGGLMAIAFAVMGDVIPARERGRYQGYMAGVFGTSSVAGPLLGGWLTDALSWHWIFFINIPIGIGALIITSIALKLPHVTRNPKIDYLGAATIVAATSTLLLYLNFAGESWGWTDPRALAFVGAFVVLVIAFVFIELRAEEPIIPMHLFRNRIFTVGNAFGFLIGTALFGGAIYLPLYFQTVHGMSPTESGLAMLPMMGGMFTMSILSGQLLVRTGKYKIYPIIGSAILGGAFFLLSTIKVDTPYWQVAIFAWLFGTGLGLSMMTIVTPIQNAVEPRDMGVASSATTFGRSLGGAIGAALFGAIMTSRLAYHLTEDLAGVAGGGTHNGEINLNDVQAIQALEEPIRTQVLTAYTDSIADIYLYALPMIVVAFVIVLFLKEIPLRTSNHVIAASAEKPDGQADAEVEDVVPAFAGH